MANIILRFVDWVGEGTLDRAEWSYRKALELSVALKEQDEMVRVLLGKKRAREEERRKALEEKLSKIMEAVRTEAGKEVEEIDFGVRKEVLKAQFFERLANVISDKFLNYSKKIESFFVNIQEDLYRANIIMPASKYISLSVGISALASQFKKKVVLIDGNLTTSDLGLHFGIYSPLTSIGDVLEKKVPISKALQKHKSGVKLLPAPFALSKTYLDLRNLKGFLSELEENELILIDSRPGLGDEIAPMLELCDGVLVITNPEFPAVTDALRVIEVTKRNNVLVEGVVLNRVRNEKHELSVPEVELFLNARIIAVVPEDPKVREGIASGNPVVLGSPNSPAAVEFKKLAAQLVGEEYAIGFFAKLKNFFRLRRKPEARVREEPEMRETVVKIGKILSRMEETLKKADEVERKPTVPTAEVKVPRLEVEEIHRLDVFLDSLKLKKSTTQSILGELTKRYEKGLVDRATYDRVKSTYERELEDYSKEIKRLEAEIEKMKS